MITIVEIKDYYSLKNVNLGVMISRGGVGCRNKETFHFNSASSLRYNFTYRNHF